MSDESDPVNIGNPDEITIKEFAEEIIKITGTGSSITYEELPEDDPQVRQPDISRAREILDWEPKVDRKEGLRRTLDYFQKKVEAEASEAS
jgi:dTDP-glucose 4,6-dehydratase